MASSKRSDREELKLVTPEFRGSYVHLRKPRVFGDREDKTPKYSITIVIPEDDAFWGKLEDRAMLAAERKWEKRPIGLILPWKRWDEYDNVREEWEGCKIVRAESEEKPGIVNADLEDILDLSEVYSGAYFRASIRPYAWHYKPANRKGISLQLDNVMKTKDGEPFSGRTKATDDFASYVDDDRPRRKRDRDEDDEDDRPRRRAAREDEDRPRRRDRDDEERPRRSRDEDDEDDRPRRRSLMD